MADSNKAQRRRFSSRERVAMYLAADGACIECGTPLESGWHGDHIRPHSQGGPTDIINGQALCPACNLAKGDKYMSDWPGPDLRIWQREALNDYIAKQQTDYLAVATPGGGKTTFALRVAHELKRTGVVERVIIVVPSEHLKVQWALAASKVGIELDPGADNANGLESREFDGSALTYAQVASQPDLHRMGCGRKATLVVLDEVHHGGDELAWGEAVRQAFEPAERRLSLSGTPFRSDNSPIPFVHYDAAGCSVPDFSYGYGRAIRDGVCRQVDFHFYDGKMRWMDAGVVTSSADLSADLADADRSAALDTALDPTKGWMRGVLETADRTLTDLREEVPNAGGLVIAYRAKHARAYAETLRHITGEAPTLVVSEDGPEANQAIERFASNSGRWLVAVKMVSEGVDVPRLAVGVYATKTKTEMFFRQAVGRFVRRKPDEEHAAVVFAPAVAPLRAMAGQIEQEIRHELDREREEFEQATREAASGQGTLPLPAVPLEASEPKFHQAIHSGQEYSPEENNRAAELLKQYGFPPSQLAAMRKLVRAELMSPNPVVVPEAVAEAAQGPAFRRRDSLKRQLATRARALAIAGGSDFKRTEFHLNQAMGVKKRSEATSDQLERGLAWVEKQFREM